MKLHKSIGPADNLDGYCLRLMQQLRKDFRGHKAEISAHMLIKFIARFSKAYGISQMQILDAMIRRNWLEPIGSDTYIIHYDLVVSKGNQ